MALKFTGGKAVPTNLPATMDRIPNAEGTQVRVIGQVQYKGKTGVIEMSGRDGSFHQVRLDNGTLASFHGSDLKPIGPIRKNTFT